MNRNQTLAAALCVLFVGILAGYLMGSGRPDIDDIDAAIGKRVDAATAAEGERISALETKLDGLTGRLDGIDQNVASGADAVKGVGEKIDTEIGKLGSGLADLGKSVESTSASHMAALDSRFSELRSALGPRSAAAPEAGAGEAAPAGIAPGGVAALAGGKLRVFVSGVTDEGARIAVNGVVTEVVPAGQTLDVKVGEETCKVSVESVDGGRVSLGGTCGS